MMAASNILMAEPKPETPKAVCKLCGKAFWSETVLFHHLLENHKLLDVARELATCYANHK
jgi:hypothetical protein